MSLPTSTELKIDSTTMSCIPELVGQSNYPIWSTRVRSVLQAYSVFEFIDRTLTHNGLQDAADRNKWKMLDCRVLGLMAGTVNDSLTSHVDFEWADQQNYPSVAKGFWEKLLALFGKAGVQGQFFLSIRLLELTSILVKPPRIFPPSSNSSTSSLNLVSISPTLSAPC